MYSRKIIRVPEDYLFEVFAGILTNENAYPIHMFLAIYVHTVEYIFFLEKRSPHFIP
jgi:hypothetical protein